MKNNFLIVGLGNPGFVYEKTRHNFGYLILNQISKKYFFSFSREKLGEIFKMNYQNKLIFFLKPSTYINQSGKSVKYWIKKKNFLLKNILIISDDLNINFGIFRLRGKGSHGGHNGLKNIEKEIKDFNYPRLRFGIKNNNYHHEKKEKYVLNNWNKEEISFLSEKINIGIKIIFSFIINGLQKTMNNFN